MGLDQVPLEGMMRLPLHQSFPRARLQTWPCATLRGTPPSPSPVGLSGVSCPPRPPGKSPAGSPRALPCLHIPTPCVCACAGHRSNSPPLLLLSAVSPAQTPIPQAWKEAGSHRPRDESILCCLSGKCCREHGVHRSGLSSGRWSWVPGSRLGPDAPLRGRSVTGLSPQHASFSCCCVLFSMF